MHKEEKDNFYFNILIYLLSAIAEVALSLSFLIILHFRGLQDKVHVINPPVERAVETS